MRRWPSTPPKRRHWRSAMSITRHSAFVSLALLAAAPPAAQAPAGAATAAPPDFANLEVTQNAANTEAGPRAVPGRSIPVPQTVSPQLRAAVAAAYRVPNWNANPKSAAEWRELIAMLAARGAAVQPAIREKLGVTMQPAVIGGVKAYILTPKEIPARNRDRLLVHVHGGGYVYNPGEAGTQGATPKAPHCGLQGPPFRHPVPPPLPSPAPEGRPKRGC